MALAEIPEIPRESTACHDRQAELLCVVWRAIDRAIAFRRVDCRASQLLVWLAAVPRMLPCVAATTWLATGSSSPRALSRARSRFHEPQTRRPALGEWRGEI